MIKPGKIYTGWWILIVCSILSSLGIVLFQQGGTIMFKPIAADLMLDRTATSMATSIGTLVSSISFALAGWLVTRFGPRWVVMAGSLISGIGMLLMNTVNSAATYYIMWGVVICAGNAMAYSIAIDTMLTNWFVRKRGLSFSIRWGIASVIAVIFLPVIAWAVEQTDWRFVCTCWGIFVLATTPILLIFVKQHRPEHYGMLPDGAQTESSGRGEADLITSGEAYAAGVQEVDFTFKDSIKTSAFWLITLGWIVLIIFISGFNLHIVPFLTDLDIDPVAASSMVALMNFFTMPSRIFGSVLADRVPKACLKYLLAGSLLLISAGLFIFLMKPCLVTIYIMLILYGLGFGAYAPLDTLIRARFFGRKAYAAIQGLSMLLSTPGAFLAPIFAGAVYDAQGNYTLAFIVLAAIGAFGGIMMCLVRAPVLAGSKQTAG